MNSDASKNGDFEVLKGLFLIIKPYKIWVIISVICAASIVACDVVSVSLIKKLVDCILSGNAHRYDRKLFNAIFFWTCWKLCYKRLKE